LHLECGWIGRSKKGQLKDWYKLEVNATGAGLSKRIEEVEEAEKAEDARC
jgi:hypothetical protein